MQQVDMSIPDSGAGNYASEVITFPYKVRALTVLVLEAPPDSGTIEVDVRGTDGVWYTAVATLSEKGVSEIMEFPAPGVELRVRGQSGGTAGDVQVAAVAAR